MSITFEIGVDLHKQLLSGCDPSSAEYRTLINGCIEERIIKAHIVEVVQIVCGREEAELILNLAASACPKAAEIIQNALKGYEWCRYRASSTTECLENLRLGRLHRPFVCNRSTERAGTNKMASMTRKKKILIVEDDAGSRKLMSILLSRSPYEIITATNGIEAFERVRTDAPVDLILMDLELPGLTGGAVIRQLKNDPSTSAIPVIVTTSSDRESPLVQEALDAGASRILYKPTPMNVLTVEVNRYLSSDVT